MIAKVLKLVVMAKMLSYHAEICFICTCCIDMTLHVITKVLQLVAKVKIP